MSNESEAQSRITQTVSAPTCALCQNPNRVELEGVLLIRSERGTLDSGEKPTLAWLKKHAEARWGWKPHGTSATRHLDKHCIVNAPGEAPPAGVLKRLDRAGARAELLAKNPELEQIEPNAHNVRETLHEIVRQGRLNILAAPHTVTPDQTIAAARVLQQANEDENQARLMQVLCEGIQRSVARHGPGVTPEPVIEATIVEEIPEAAAPSVADQVDAIVAQGRPVYGAPAPPGGVPDLDAPGLHD